MVSISPRATSSGAVRWRVQARIDRQMKQVTFPDKKSADQFASLVERVGWEAASEARAPRIRRPLARPTLRQYTERYLDLNSGLLTGIEGGTREGYRAEAERSWLQILGDLRVDEISRPDVGAWLAWQERQPIWRDRDKPQGERKTVSSKTVKNYHALLSAVLRSAVGEGLRADNPAYKMRITRGVRQEAVFLSPSEFDTLMHFIPESYQRFILFLVGTGLRWGEATALTWADVNLFGAPPTIRVTRAWKKSKGGPVLSYPKTSRSRRSVSLFPDLVAIMGEPGTPDEWVFPAPQGGHMWHGTFNTRVWVSAVEKAMSRHECERAGLEHLRRAPTIHSLRHTHASWLIAQGIPLPYIQARLGHESITTTSDTYGHLVADAHEQMATAIAVTLSGGRRTPAISPK